MGNKSIEDILKEGEKLSNRRRDPSNLGRELGSEEESSKSDEDPPEEQKKKDSGLFWVFLILAVGVSAYLRNQEAQETPKLYEFGKKSWIIQCKNEDRSYHLRSYNPRSGSSGTADIHTRNLNFLDKNGKTVYQTRAFDSEALDKRGVWRFSYNPIDIRILAEKAEEKVLEGDEKSFEIAENFQSMTVLTNTGMVELSCVREK